MKIKLFNPKCMPVKADTGDWYDLCVAEDIWVKPNNGHHKAEVTMIPLGIAAELPEGKFAIIAPRSSTAKRHGIILAGSIGIIDNEYNGPSDQWMFPAISLLEQGSIIQEGTRIAQFHLFDVMPDLEFEVSSLEENENRGGFGSTGE